MDKSNAKPQIEETTKRWTNQMQNPRQKKQQGDGQIKCKILDRRNNKEMDKSNAKSQIEEKTKRWTNQMQNHSEKKKQEIKFKNIDKIKAKRWSNRM